jgi:hypothetical protein
MRRETRVFSKIGTRGPVVLRLADGGCLDLWYDGPTRSWVLQQRDAQHNQVGPGHDGTAVYVHTREEAVKEMVSIIRALPCTCGLSPHLVICPQSLKETP